MTLRRVSIRAFALVVLCTATVSAPAEGELRSFALTNWDEDDDARVFHCGLPALNEQPRR